MKEVANKKQKKKVNLISIFIMGKKYRVPETLTIMKALEFSGYKYIRGCGCRGGICGACATVYRLPDDYRIHVGLSCQTVVEPNMYLAQIPFFPANRASYNVAEMKPLAEQVLEKYPEVARCLCCNTCTKACPQELEVMEYVQAALRGDLERVARLSFECIMCGLCAARCPADIVQYHAAELCRRLYAKHMVPEAEDLKKRVKEIDEKKFDKELESYAAKKIDELKKLYNERDIEPV